MKKTVYRWREGFRMPADPQEVGGFLDAIKKKSGGRLRTVDVFEAAKDPDSVLHNLFEWDKDKALEKYGLETARRVIRSIETEVIITGERQEHVRAFVNVVKAGDQFYATVPEVLSDEEAMIYRRNKALQAFVRARDEHPRFEEFEPIYSAIDEALAITEAV